MTAKEEARALAEKWLDKGRKVELWLKFTDDSGRYWVEASKEDIVGDVWHRCVGIRLLFQA